MEVGSDIDTDVRSVAAFFERVELFSGVPARALELSAARALHRNYPEKSVIFAEGSVGDAIFIIGRGQVKLSSVDLDGHEKILAILHPPDFFGEMALIDSSPRSATATTITPVDVLIMFSDDWRQLSETFPQLAHNVTKTLAVRLRRMHDEARILSYKDARGRVAYALLGLISSGVAHQTGANSASVHLTHQELASIAGTSRETVTRALRALEDLQIIETKTKEILILDVIRLESVLHGLD